MKTKSKKKSGKSNDEDDLCDGFLMNGWLRWTFVWFVGFGAGGKGQKSVTNAINERLIYVLSVPL